MNEPRPAVLVSGASGFVGQALLQALRRAGHEVARLVRRPAAAEDEVTWDPAAGQLEAGELARFQAVVHLAGESISQGRWTAAKKARILRSRVDGTRLLAEAVATLEHGPRTLLVASAVGYYGSRGDEALSEESPPGQDFLAQVCQAWESAAEPARGAGIRTVHTRFGLILSPAGGALPRLLPLFALGLGGRLGSGRQYWSWIALDDVVGAIMHALADGQLAGAVNTVAPNPVSNAEFSAMLARVLGRPAILPAPAAALRLALGEMADGLLLASQRALPTRLEGSGFRFQQTELEPTLRSLLKR